MATAIAPSKRRPPRGTGREALCRALVRVVARKGLDGVTFRAVAAEAGVTHGLASYHFRTRDAMIHEALSLAAQEAIRDSTIAAGAERLEDFARDLPALMEARPEEAIFQFALALEALRRRALLPDVRASYDEYIATVRDSLVRFGVGEDDALARVVFAALDGLNLQHLIYGSADRTAESLEALRGLLACRATP